MNRPHTTAREAEHLHARWYDAVAVRVREAAVKARERLDRHRSDLEALHHGPGAVDLHGPLEPEPDAAPGTPARAVADADRLPAEAEQHHAWGAHTIALVWLQQANHIIDLLARCTAKPDIRPRRSDGPIPPPPTAHTDTGRGDPDEGGSPGDTGAAARIPRQPT